MGFAVLQRENPQVSLYLRRAEQARGRAFRSADPEMRVFYGRMEASWTRLATSVAFTDRVDLFLHTRNHNLPPMDMCTACYSAMRLKSAEAADGAQILTFECLECRCEQVRKI